MGSKEKTYCQRCGSKLRDTMIGNNVMEVKQGLFCLDCGEDQRQKNINEFDKKR